MKMVASGCCVRPGRSRLRVGDGLVSKEEAQLNRWEIGKVYYTIEGLGPHVVKMVLHRN